MTGQRTLDPPTASVFSEFWNKIERHFGLRYSTTRYPAIKQKVLERALEAGCTSADEYLKKFTEDSFNAREYEFWATALTVNETYFMRTASDWKALQHTILPNLIQSKRATRNIKFASVGCASGEEVYTAALIIANWFPELLDWHLQLIGGDIDTALLEIAREGGPYSERSIRLLDPRIRDEYLFQRGGSWFVRDSLKTYTDFRYFNIMKSVDPLLTRDVDVLFCRNMLIYFDTPTAMQCLRKCVNALSPEGMLILGSSEGFLADEAGHPAAIVGGSFLVRRTNSDSPRLAPGELGTDAPGLSDSDSTLNGPVPHTTQIGGRWQSPDQLLDESRALIDRGDLAEARRKLGTVLLRQNSSVYGHYLLGVVYEHVGALEKALEEFEEVIRLAPDYCMAYLQSILLHKRLGMQEMAYARLLVLSRLLDSRRDDDIIDEEQQLSVGFLRLTCQNLYFDLDHVHANK
jgi:chemotaxis protein methyltransferase CheR